MKSPRCAKHTNETMLPALCHTCQRINVEHLIVHKLVDVFIKKGYLVWEDQDGFPGQPREETLELLLDLDEARLNISKWPEAHRQVFLVFGNDGYDVIADYHSSLDEDGMEEVNDYAATFDR